MGFLTGLPSKTNLVSQLLATYPSTFCRANWSLHSHWTYIQVCVWQVYCIGVYGKVTGCVCVCLRERVQAGSDLAVLGVLQLSRCIAGISERAIKTEGRVRGEVAIDRQGLCHLTPHWLEMWGIILGSLRLNGNKRSTGELGAWGSPDRRSRSRQDLRTLLACGCTTACSFILAVLMRVNEFSCSHLLAEVSVRKLRGTVCLHFTLKICIIYVLSVCLYFN